jgi:uncharacterized protein (TIGR02147 family)
MKRPLMNAQEALTKAIDAHQAKFPNVSLRAISARAGLSAGLLPLILAGKKSLTPKVAEKIAMALKLAPGERTELIESSRMERETLSGGRADAFRRVSRSKAFMNRHPIERVTFQYFYEWFLPVLREMAVSVNFNDDPVSLSERMLFPLPPSQAKKALEFLLKAEFIEKQSDGTYRFPQGKAIECEGEVFRLALSSFHKTGALHAVESIEKVPREERYLDGITVALDESDWPEFKQEIEQIMTRIQERAKRGKKRTRVYRFGVYAYPYTKKQNR